MIVSVSGDQLRHQPGAGWQGVWGAYLPPGSGNHSLIFAQEALLLPRNVSNMLQVVSVKWYDTLFFGGGRGDVPLLF